MTKPKTISEYIDAAPKESQEKLRELLNCLRKTAPDATEDIKWGSPVLSYDRILFAFAGFKKHIGFYPTPAVIDAFAKELKDFEVSSSTIKFPLDKPLPLDLIHKIAALRVKEVKENDARWM
jgi:uncharacterized protein YdhG (YjbR/CyaY superfamily)